MTIPSIIKYFFLAVVFSLLVSGSDTFLLSIPNPSPFYIGSVTYGILAAGTLLYFNKKLVLQSIAILAASSGSLYVAMRLDPGMAGTVTSSGSWGGNTPMPSIVFVSLIGGAVIWISLLLLCKSLRWKKFLIFSLVWFFACLMVGIVGEKVFYFATLQIMFVWQTLTLFLLCWLFSQLRIQTIESPEPLKIF